MEKVERYKTARLLTKAEWEDVIATIPGIPIDVEYEWWLAPDDKYWAVRDDRISEKFASRVICAIRPVLELQYSGTLPCVGDKVMVGSTPCTVISVTKITGNVTAFADKVVCFHALMGIDKYINSSTFRSLVYKRRTGNG